MKNAKIIRPKNKIKKSVIPNFLLIFSVFIDYNILFFKFNYIKNSGSVQYDSLLVLTVNLNRSRSHHSFRKILDHYSISSE